MVNEAVDPAIYEVRPQVVVWMSVWEKSDLVVDGQTLVFGNPRRRRGDSTPDGL